MGVMLVLIVHKTPQDEGRPQRAMQVSSIPVIGMLGEDTIIPKNAERSRKTVGDGVWVIRSASYHLFEEHVDLPAESIRLTVSTNIMGCGVYFDDEGMLKLIPREVMQSVERL